MWEQYSWQVTSIVTALLIQTALIIVLFYERRRRHDAESISHSALAKLTHMNRIATASELTASISHEVNQPLGAIVANANAALRFLTNKTPDLEEVRAALQRVVSDGHRASGVIGSIRTMFKNEDQKNSVDLNGLIQEVLGHVRQELQRQGVVTQTALTEPLPSVLGNHGQLQQVILNLIRNAADAMASVSDRPWVLRMKSTVEDPDSVLVTVEDSGTGIDSRDINRIFQAFFTTKANGMGMGLPIYRTIIEAHGGRLSVSSGVDHGAVFIIHLPAVVAEIGKNRVGEKG